MSILLVDDEESVRGIFAKGLARVGFRVVTVNGGEAAWESLHSEKFDLLITDHNMPDMSGLDLIRKLRMAKNTLPSLLISGNMPMHERDLHEVLQPGAMLHKPFNIEDLLRCAKRLLETHSR